MIVGHSGSGKSTLMNMLGTFVNYFRGGIFLSRVQKIDAREMKVCRCPEKNMKK